MSAHCSKHGCDLVYITGEWPEMECRECELEKEITRLTEIENAVREFLFHCTKNGEYKGNGSSFRRLKQALEKK